MYGSLNENPLIRRKIRYHWKCFILFLLCGWDWTRFTSAIAFHRSEITFNAKASDEFSPFEFSFAFFAIVVCNTFSYTAKCHRALWAPMGNLQRIDFCINFTLYVHRTCIFFDSCDKRTNQRLSFRRRWLP